MENLLPGVPYFIVTFTLPGSLREYSRKEELYWYDLFFEASSNALMELMAEEKNLGGEGGFFGVLQTWCRDLTYHPHIHYIVPGGALVTRTKKIKGQRKLQRTTHWKKAKNGTKGPYLINAYEAQAAVRMRMQEAVKSERPELYETISGKVWWESWRVDFQHAGNGEAVLKYLARYITKSAISNPQIRRVEEDRVTFSYTPNGGHHCEYKELTAHDFMSRVLQHALPKGFKRVRYFGWLHPAAKKRLAMVKLLIGKPMVYKQRNEAQPPQPSGRMKCKQCQSTNLKAGEKIPALRSLVKHCWERATFGPSQISDSLLAAGVRAHGSRAPPVKRARRRGKR